MKIFTPLLLTLSLALGTIAAITAYLPQMDDVEDALANGVILELGASSGKTTGPDGIEKPVATAGERLTPQLLAELRAAGVERVRVRQFAFARWSHRWLFAAAAAGLVAGAVLIRRQRRDIVTEAVSGSPEAAMAAVKEVLSKLAADLPALSEKPDGMREVTGVLGELQVTHIDIIVQAREHIIAAGGLAGFAAFMSSFAVMERQVNRAWSAAADDAAGEVAECLKRAIVLAEDVEKLLPGK